MTSNQTFNTQKLEFYLKHSDKGFILLTVNDLTRQNILLDLCSVYAPTKSYNLKDFHFRESLSDFSTKADLRNIIYYGFYPDSIELHDLLEKINLSRDLLLEHHKLFIFIVPFYVEKIFQKDYPNLYSYFILKENYVKHYDVFLEYIRFGSNYLITKEAQKEFKRHYISNNEDLNERLNYFSHAKLNKKDLHALVKDVEDYTSKIAQNTEYQDDFYFHTVSLRLADVLFAQNEYEESFLRYKDIFYSVGHSVSTLYCDSLLGLGDCCCAMNKYDDAIFYYNYLLSMLAMQPESDDIFHKYSQKVYMRIALCYAEFGMTQKAQTYMDNAINLIQNTDAFSNEYFELYYNHIIFQLRTEFSAKYKITSLLIHLKESAHTNIQIAMYLTLSAWYYGVIEGDLTQAMADAFTALALKRKFFIENDSRIAESHYVISILYLLLGNYENALHCCNKCKNILKNSDLPDKQKQLIDKLWTEIQLLINQRKR